MLRFRFAMIAFVLGIVSIASGQTQRGFLPTDLSALKDVSDGQISPDGSKIVYVVSETTPDRARTVSRLWIVPAAGGEPKRLTIGEANESTPRWSPDGKSIAFFSNRGNRDGLWVVPASIQGAVEPKLLTYIYRTNFFLAKSGESFTWSPDCKQIAFLSSIEVLNDASTIAATNTPVPTGVPPAAARPLSREDIDKLPIEVREMLFRAQGQAMGLRPQSPIENALSPIPDDPRVITRLRYKSRTSFSDNSQSHIFVVDLDTRRIRQITTGLYYEHSINWSPKGDEVVFISNHEPDPDKVNNSDLFTVNVNTFAIRQLTKTKGCELQPSFSPDGSEIAYLATRREITTIDSVAEDTHIYVISAQGGEPRDMQRGIDRRASLVKWCGPKQICVTIGDQGRTLIYRMSDASAEMLLPRASSQISGLSFSQNGSFAFIQSNPTQPGEVYTRLVKTEDDRLQVIEPKQLTNINTSFLGTLKLSEPIEFTFKNEDLEVQGWLVPPIELSSSIKNIETKGKESGNGRLYPVILYIHGGPHGMHGYGFNPNAQAMAAQGYAVLLINPRGSSGYGQKFADGCINDWGGGDYRDLMKGVDEALTRWPFLNKDRMGVIGGSYGGYMTNWIVTQTDRYKAAVAQASVSNLISFYSTSLYQDLVHAEFNGFPWNNFEILWERSPLKHITKAKTPLLLLHGEQDNDVHITQAEEMYTAMRMRGIASVLVRYPREGHGLREPRHREDSLARALQWFDRHLKQ